MNRLRIIMVLACGLLFLGCETTGPQPEQDVPAGTYGPHAIVHYQQPVTLNARQPRALIGTAHAVGIELIDTNAEHQQARLAIVVFDRDWQVTERAAGWVRAGTYVDFARDIVGRRGVECLAVGPDAVELLIRGATEPPAAPAGTN